MTNPTPLTEVAAASSLFTLNTDPNAAIDAISDWDEAGLTVRTIRGSKMRTKLRLFEEMSAALQFPYYFGENWDALEECIADLAWLSYRNGIVIFIREAALALIDEPTSQLRVLVEIFEDARSAFAEPVDNGHSWDRPAVPFHIVLHADEDQRETVLDRWSAAGAEIKLAPTA